MHFLSHAVPTSLGLENRLVKQTGQIVRVQVGAQDDIAASPPIPAIRSPLRHEFFASKANATTPAFTGLAINFDPIYKHALNI